MPSSSIFYRFSTVLLTSSLLLAGCKRTEATLPAAQAVDPAPSAAQDGNAPGAAAASQSAAPSTRHEASAPAATVAFDPDSVPLSTATLPPFPYIDYPDGLDKAFQINKNADFDTVYVIAGNALREVEGRMESRRFRHKQAKLSAVESLRNYETAIKALGGVKVNTVAPEHPAIVAAMENEHRTRTEKMHIFEPKMAYSTYLIRTPQERIWIGLANNERQTQWVVVQEKALAQRVGYVKADAMRKELDASGHVALYINFDTDKASVRPDGKPAIDEIVTLLKNDPALKLTIEGHTDNSGNPAHNKDLSQRRAETVMAVLVSAGIAQDRLKAVGLGDTKPLTDNKDDAARATNRRVELVKRSTATGIAPGAFSKDD